MPLLSLQDCSKPSGMWWHKKKEQPKAVFPFKFRIVYRSSSGIRFQTDFIRVTVHATSKEEAIRYIKLIVPIRTEIEIIEKISTNSLIISD